MTDVNKAILIGHLACAPRIKVTRDGMRAMILSVKTESVIKRKMSEDTYTQEHRVVVIRDRVVPIMEGILKKGSRVYVEGQMRTRIVMDDDGRDKEVFDIIVGNHPGECFDLIKDVYECDKEKDHIMYNRERAYVTEESKTH